MTQVLMVIAGVLMMLSIVFLFTGNSDNIEAVESKSLSPVTERILPLVIVVGSIMALFGIRHDWALWLGIILIESACLCYQLLRGKKIW